MPMVLASMEPEDARIEEDRFAEREVAELARLVQHNASGRLPLLEIEEMLVAWMDLKPEDPILHLPPASPYFRMLVHRLVETFGLTHVSFGEGEDRHIVVQRNEESKIPAVLLSDLLNDYCRRPVTDATPQILQRPSAFPADVTPAPLTSLPSLAERQLAYEEARARIFAQSFDGVRKCSPDDEYLSAIVPSRERRVPVVARRLIGRALGKQSELVNRAEAESPSAGNRLEVVVSETGAAVLEKSPQLVSETGASVLEKSPQLVNETGSEITSAEEARGSVTTQESRERGRVQASRGRAGVSGTSYSSGASDGPSKITPCEAIRTEVPHASGKDTACATQTVVLPDDDKASRLDLDSNVASGAKSVAANENGIRRGKEKGASKRRKEAAPDGGEKAASDGGKTRRSPGGVAGARMFRLALTTEAGKQPREKQPGGKLLSTGPDQKPRGEQPGQLSTETGKKPRGKQQVRVSDQALGREECPVARTGEVADSEEGGPLRKRTIVQVDEGVSSLNTAEDKVRNRLEKKSVDARGARRAGESEPVAQQASRVERPNGKVSGSEQHVGRVGMPRCSERELPEASTLGVLPRSRESSAATDAEESCQKDDPFRESNRRDPVDNVAEISLEGYNKIHPGAGQIAGAVGDSAVSRGRGQKPRGLPPTAGKMLSHALGLTGRGWGQVGRSKS